MTNLFCDCTHIEIKKKKKVIHFPSTTEDTLKLHFNIALDSLGNKLSDNIITVSNYRLFCSGGCWKMQP